MLTGIANRAGALDHLKRLDVEVRRTGQVYGVCFCDIDAVTDQADKDMYRRRTRAHGEMGSAPVAVR